MYRFLHHRAARAAAILAELLLFTGLSGRSPAAAEPWTLERVVDTVRRRDPGVVAARAGGDAARARASQSRGALSPRVSFETAWLRGDDPALLFSQKLQQGRLTAGDLALPALNQPPAATSLQWGLVLEQPIWNAGHEVTGPGLASHQLRAAAAAESAAVAERLLQAVELYVGAVRTRAAAAADSIALAAAESYRAAAAERLRMGQTSPLDSMRAGARAGEARLRWLASRQAARLSLERLGARVGARVEADSLAALPEMSVPPASEPGARAEIVSARESSVALATESKRAGMGLLPSINSRFTWTHYRDLHAGDWEPRWTAAVLLELPLWDGRRRYQDWSAARARARQAEENLVSMERDLALDLDAARSDADLALEQRSVARETHDAAEEALRFAAARYQSGLLTLTELLATDAEAAHARQTRVDAEAAAVLAHYRLLHARGELR